MVAPIAIPGAGDEVQASWGQAVAEQVNALAVPIGVECPSAAALTITNAEIFVAAPVGGSDPKGFYQPTGPNAKRLVIPAGLGGLYAFTLGGSCVGGTSGNLRRLTLTIGGVVWGGQALVGQAGNSMLWLLSGTIFIPAGGAIRLDAQAVTSNADFAIQRAALYRIGLS